MVQSLKVILWGEEIGRLAWDGRRRLSYFMYNPVFLKKGLDIFPLVAPSHRSLPIRCLTLGEINCLICGVNRITCPMQILLLLTSFHL